MPYVMVDIESERAYSGDYSMVCFGAVIVEPALNRTFYGSSSRFPTPSSLMPLQSVDLREMSAWTSMILESSWNSFAIG